MADADRNEFYKQLREILEDKTAPNSFVVNAAKYSHLLQQVKDAHTKIKKEPADYRRMKRYEIIQTADGERLAMSKLPGQSTQQIFVSVEEMYDVIHNYHLKLNHAGRTKMMVAIKPYYKNITSRVVMMYLSLCRGCKSKVKRIKVDKTQNVNDESCEIYNIAKYNLDFSETYTTDPLQSISKDLSDQDLRQSIDGESTKIYPELFSRGQIDIIDVTISQDECYKYLLVYRNLVTRFIHLKPLKSVTIEECVDSLLEIFLVFGAPNILQSKNGMSVTKQICRRMYIQYPEIKVVCAEVDLQKQNFTGQTNQDILKLLSDWLKENTPQKWHQGLKHVQYILNNTFNETICRTPSESVFGYNPKRGLASFMSRDEYNHITNEEEFRIALEEKESGKHSEQLLLEESLIPSASFIKSERETDEADIGDFDMTE